MLRVEPALLFKWLLILYLAYKFCYNAWLDPTGPDWAGIVVDVLLIAGILFLLL